MSEKINYTNRQRAHQEHAQFLTEHTHVSMLFQAILVTLLYPIEHPQLNSYEHAQY